MCGILVVVYTLRTGTAEKLLHHLKDLLTRRGHDSVNSRHYDVCGAEDQVFHIDVVGCVLHMRGDLTPQPLHTDKNDWLLWNGEVFGSTLFNLDDSHNDTDMMLKALSACDDNTDLILDTFNSIHGPWSMAYYQHKSQSIWFGRDVIGRRSLVWHLPHNNRDIFAISSVACYDSKHFPRGYWSEVPAIGVFNISLTNNMFQPGSVVCYPWIERDSDLVYHSLEEISSCFTISQSKRLKVPFVSLNKSLPSPIRPVVDCSKQLLELLENAVRKRVINSSKANIGILFSGGIDSSVLAALADKCLKPEVEIDLINVSFDQSSHPGLHDFNTPDRQTSIAALEELNRNRKWNLILVNITREELHYMRTQHISHLIYPLNTVLDDSIGCALWFAARGNGILYSTGTAYESQCKVLLVGMGADEQLCGYSRHRTKYQKTGWNGLILEIDNDFKHLSSRNLGRDDRCISDHHREARFPYLDEDVIHYLNSLPMWRKADLTQPRGQGEKYLLREVATILGCPKIAGIPKRAIQFGSRIAKLSGSAGGKEGGNDLCDRLILHEKL